MTKKGLWCGVVKWSPKKQQRPFPFIAVKLVSYCPLNLLTLQKLEVDLEKWVLDRALGIGKRAATDACVKCWANPVWTGCPYKTEIPPPSVRCDSWCWIRRLACGCIYGPSMFTRVVLWQSLKQNTIISPMMRRKNIHSLLTLAAEPSEPGEGAAVRPQGWHVSQKWWAESRPDLGP